MQAKPASSQGFKLSVKVCDSYGTFDNFGLSKKV